MGSSSSILLYLYTDLSILDHVIIYLYTVKLQEQT